jgi:hypothetical protein
MNSTYNYDPASRKDEFVDMVANALTIAVPALRPDVPIIVGTFPLCESILLFRIRSRDEPVWSAPSPVVVPRYGV